MLTHHKNNNKTAPRIMIPVMQGLFKGTAFDEEGEEVGEEKEFNGGGFVLTLTDESGAEPVVKVDGDTST